MFDDETTVSVPDSGDSAELQAAPTSENQTPGEGSEQTQAEPKTEAKPESSAPKPLTREDVAVLLRGELEQLIPHLATRQDLDKAAQRGADKRFATLMKQLAPDMRGIDAAVKRGLLDKDQAEQAKRDLFAEKAVEMMGKDDDEEQAQSPLPIQRQPQADAQQATQQRAQALLERSGLTWTDVPEVRTKPMPFSDFEALVEEKRVAKRLAAEKEKWMKERDQQTKQVRDADALGATKPPAGGLAGETKKKRTLDDADEVGARIAEKYFKR